MPDYYATLGVARTASQDEIKRAYRKLARESHPDANPGDAQAEERFKQVSEAYKVLSDPQSRQRYDQFGEAGVGGQGFAGFGDFGDIMDAFFGGASPFGGARTRRRSSAVPGQDIGVEVTISLEEAVSGVTTPIEVQGATPCERCEGDGTEPGTSRAACPACGGAGEVRSQRQTILGTVMTASPCRRCDGAGEAPTDPCSACRGIGRVRAARTIKVQIPPGVDDGMTVRLRGQGDAGVRGGGDGDLFVRVNVAPHEVFEREGDDLHVELSIGVTHAVLGATLPVETLDGAEELAIPAGTQHGTVVRLRGQGVPHVDGRGRGDLHVHIAVDIPRSLSDRERELFEELAQIRGDEVGDGGGGGLFRRMRDSLRGG